ncbi:type I-E CRISPR-associated protein Cse1/CasA [Amycolatopsis sp. FDAARGOS 1241]|uniref:type I-E CRISPR-associated protein Cse1/CasA n=1 Tax=Amycolatopsis sp. FDAARGOS 1241 TaxID=2778070 RepID=UPI00194E1898|nr:type I-E CRISPR-associated protein Cse1/CasA [Amycolatopsis sp. FDAARGOS 1241]QRP46033.1 type I-E CRISPR-associated protein Cse1/CasA [Amycolatopsis sp. FDAARGOS 1241]
MRHDAPIPRGFNLLDEPWITVLAHDGQERDVSLLGLFEQAPELVVIGGEVPTQGYAITRLLLAFLHRALDGPADQESWSRLWKLPVLPMDQVRAYADRVRHRFDLFDECVPFFQVAGLRTAKGEVSGLDKIVADVPNGEPLFTTRSAASLTRITAAEAARWLVHVHAFDPSGIKSGAVGDPTVKSGKGYPIGPGWSGQVGGVLAQGRDVRETLLLNLITRDVETYVQVGGQEDLPPWERDSDGATWAEDRPVAGVIQAYTWQTRRVRLEGDRDGVTGVVLANGDRMQPQNRQLVEPHTAWRYSEPQSKKAGRPVYMPRRHDPSRSVWRGLAAMLPSISPRRSSGGDPARFLAPGVLQWLSDLVEEEYLPSDFVVRFRVHGVEYGAQNATYAEILDDLLPLPVVLLRHEHPAAGRTAARAVGDADAAAGCLWRLAENLAQAAGAEPQSGAGAAAQESFYARLEHPYRSWLAGLRPGRDLVEASTAWQRTVRTTCLPIKDALITGAATAAWTGRQVNQRLVNVPLAEVWFNDALRTALPLVYTSVNTPAEAMK